MNKSIFIKSSAFLTLVLLLIIFTVFINSFLTPITIADWQVENSKILFSREFLRKDMQKFKEIDERKIQNVISYKYALLHQGEKKKIPFDSLKKALDIAESKMGWRITKIPAIIETVRYKNKDALVLFFKVDYTNQFIWNLNHLLSTTKLTASHFRVFVIEEESNKILFSEACM